MPKESKRGNQLEQSPIRNLVPYARAATKRGTHIFHLNIGQPDIPTPPDAIQKVKEDTSSTIKYGPSEGLFSLRERVADYYKKFNVEITGSDVFVTTGASEAIMFALLAVCDPGDEVIVPEPFYANYIGFANIASTAIVPLSTTIDSQFALPSNEDFAKKINPKTKAILLCNPGNPTGQLYTKEDLKGILELVKAHDLYLIVDEVYREFCYDEEFTSVLTFDALQDHIIVIDSISKVFSACGARVGYLITKSKVVQETVIKYAQLRLCPPYFGQKLAEFCYDNADQYIQIAKAEYLKRREVLYDGLSKIDHLKFYKPKAAFYNIVELPVADSHEFCKWLLSDFSHNNNTVMLAPANGFYFNRALGVSQARIAYVLNESDLEKALECLDLGLKQFHESFPMKIRSSYSYS